MEKGLNSHDTLLLNAELSLSFESIQYKLLQFINKKYQLDSRSIADLLLDYEKQGKNVVLIIDDAGFLLTGLINALINYAKEHSALKLVFSLTPDELSIKSQTDGLNNSCHYIDLLSLNYSQTAMFVHQLIAAGTQYIETDINKTFLQELYKESAGNLSAIQSFLKKDKKGYMNNVAVLILLVAIVSIMISTFLWRGAEESEHKVLSKSKKLALVESLAKVKIKKNEAKSSAEKIVIAKQFEVESNEIEKVPVITLLGIPAVTMPKIQLPQLNIPVVQLSDIPKEGSTSEKTKLPAQEGTKEVTKEIEIEVVATSSPAVLSVKKIVIPAVIKDIDDRAWILEQKETAYTMQLMALSSIHALLQEQQKFKDMDYKTYFLLTESHEKQVYTLYYGVFESIEDAKSKSLALPIAMKKSWLRKISSIKNKLN
jgi:DamX protein